PLPHLSPLSLHDALPICLLPGRCAAADIAIDHIEFVQVVQDHDNHVPLVAGKSTVARVFLTSSGNDGQDITSGISGSLVADSLRSEEHTSELQSRFDLVC